MSAKTLSIIFNTAEILFAITSFFGAISVWFFGYHPGSLLIGWNFFFIGAIVVIFARVEAKDSSD